jgi:hypothetical protein
MESEFIAQLVDLGVSGLFIGVLLFGYKKQTERLDEYVTRLLETLKELEVKREAGYESIRDRYDVVIEKYQEERDVLLREISDKLDEGLKVMAKMEQDQRMKKIARGSSND